MARAISEPKTAPRILYIEDNVSNLKLMERIVERCGCGCVELIPAMQGSIGLELARNQRPDVIIIDLHLPDIDGEEVLRHLKAEPETREIPVVALTADLTESLPGRLRALGASDFFSKPIDVVRFLEVIATHIGDARARAAVLED